MAYATRAELASLGVSSSALGDVLSADQDKALESASDTADGYLRARFRLPLLAWGDDLKRVVCEIAAYNLMSVRGAGPEGLEDLRRRFDDAKLWLLDVSRGHVTPVVTETTPAQVGAAHVMSNARRGW